MIEILIFSKSGLDFILFRFEHDYELKTILTLEGKTIRNLEHRENVVTGQLEKEICKDE